MEPLTLKRGPKQFITYQLMSKWKCSVTGWTCDFEPTVENYRTFVKVDPRFIFVQEDYKSPFHKEGVMEEI